ncbi:MAG TPA: hypothetical protein VHZ02_02365 [Acidimicrobiales bacterium]|jgi:hypothetical protein|nr:hypothetical protein [Acidimicrobiales bacterium]
MAIALRMAAIFFTTALASGASLVETDFGLPLMVSASDKAKPYRASRQVP